MKEWLLSGLELPTQHRKVEDLLYCTATYSELCLLLCNDCFCLRVQSIQDYLQQYLARMSGKADGIRMIITAGFEISFFWKRDNG